MLEVMKTIKGSLDFFFSFLKEMSQLHIHLFRMAHHDLWFSIYLMISLFQICQRKASGPVTNGIWRGCFSVITHLSLLFAIGFN